MSALDVAVHRLLNRELTEDIGFEAEKELAELRAALDEAREVMDWANIAGKPNIDKRIIQKATAWLKAHPKEKNGHV